jgi:hypothetical protein
MQLPFCFPDPALKFPDPAKSIPCSSEQEIRRESAGYLSYFDDSDSPINPSTAIFPCIFPA